MAFANDANNFYIQGGRLESTTPLVSQFFSLDITTSWSVTNPAWTRLPDIPSTSATAISGSSGSLDKAGRFIVVSTHQDQNNAIYIYHQNAWQTHTLSSPLQVSSDTLVATISNSTSEKIYLFSKSSSFNADLSLDNSLQKTLPLIQLNGASNIDSGHVISTSNTPNYPGILRIVPNAGAIPKIALQQFSEESQSWNTIAIDGAPTARREFCFVASIEEPSKYYLFGGLDPTGKGFNELYVLDLSSINLAWILLVGKGTAPAARSSMACAATKNMLIIWGGIGVGALNNSTPVLYDIANNNWDVTQFTGSGASPPGSGPSSDPLPTSSIGGASSGNGTNVGAIVGGAVGGLVVIAAIVGFLFMRKRKNHKARNVALAKSGGKADSSSVEMGGYKSIPSPFKSEENLQQGPTFSSSAPSPPLEYTAAPHVQNPYPQRPAIPSRPSDLHSKAHSQISQSSLYSQPPVIQSPFEAEPDMSSQHLLGSRGLPTVPQAAERGPYHDRGVEDERTTVTSRSMEPATVDLIPITESDAGEGSQASRSNSLESSRDGAVRGTTSRKSHGGGTTSTATAIAATSARSDDNKRGLLYEQEESRRDSNESLEYLDIS
ncbi:hypothetical protein BGX27_009476 [Mortierella sp. AM989]|nr:hypothetical protein BGX27_009476 [Mortierella sp. AM989]